VTRAISNAAFLGRGLISLELEWLRHQNQRDIAQAQLTLALG
jgi:hypothetical protein